MKRAISGMRPTGALHVGHYFGALTNWLRMQQEFDCYFFVADWHALTTHYADSSLVASNTLQVATDWLAVGLDPAKATLFIQSSVPEHAELHLLLSMITPLSWLERVPTYKEQIENLREKDLGTYGFLGYPLLQSADIVMYGEPGYELLVPVGEDQAPHIEMTREIVRKFNFHFGEGAEVLREPHAILTETPRVTGTDGRRMAKSYGNAIWLSDSEKDIRAKVRNMMTDPQRVYRTDRGRPEVCPVFAYHNLFPEKKSAEDCARIEHIDRECRTAEIGCVDCKKLMADALVKWIAPIQERRAKYEANPAQVWNVLEEGSKRAKKVAERTMARVRKIFIG